jgi:hypothetical protein
MRSAQYASCALNYTQQQQADARMLVLQQESFVDDPGGQGVAGSNPVVPTVFMQVRPCLLWIDRV